MNRETRTIIFQLVNTLRFTLDQLETNYQQACSKGHNWPNERVNMTSAAKLQARNTMKEADEFLATQSAT